MATTLSRMMKKAAASSSLIPLASSTVCPRKYYTTAIRSIPLKTSCIIISTSNITNLSRQVFPIHHHHHFSALAEKRPNTDDTFLRAIESEIHCNEEKFHQAVEAPKEFPFKIEDNPGEETNVTLTRDYQGEEIRVTVRWPHFSPYYMELDVRVLQKDGQTFVFQVGVEEETHDIKIENLGLKNPNDSHDYIPYEEPYFEDWDKDLQKAYYSYLEVRGIEPSIVQFLHDCLVHKKRKKYDVWLKELMNFIAERRSTNTVDTPFRLTESKIWERYRKAYSLFSKSRHKFLLPNELSYKIEENRTITLTREYQGEEIQVKVKPHYLATDQQHVDLVGSVSKKSGLALKFNVTAFANGMKFKSFHVDKDIAFNTPCFMDLDDNLKKAYRAYLEARGIGFSITKMMRESPTKKVMWLGNG